jgi:hypothetical protein
MFEEQQGQSYVIQNQSINSDTFTWKTYNQTLQLNKYNLLELKFDLSDTTIYGTKDYFLPLNESINRY